MVIVRSNPIRNPCEARLVNPARGFVDAAVPPPLTAPSVALRRPVCAEPVELAKTWVPLGALMARHSTPSDWALFSVTSAMRLSTSTCERRTSSF
jgi:hypothetical protein